MFVVHAVASIVHYYRQQSAGLLRGVLLGASDAAINSSYARERSQLNILWMVIYDSFVTFYDASIALFVRFFWRVEPPWGSTSRRTSLRPRNAKQWPGRGAMTFRLTPWRGG